MQVIENPSTSAILVTAANGVTDDPLRTGQPQVINAKQDIHHICLIDKFHRTNDTARNIVENKQRHISGQIVGCRLADSNFQNKPC